jgi:hypothetical protein
LPNNRPTSRIFSPHTYPNGANTHRVSGCEYPLLSLISPKHSNPKSIQTISTSPTPTHIVVCSRSWRPASATPKPSGTSAGSASPSINQAHGHRSQRRPRRGGGARADRLLAGAGLWRGPRGGSRRSRSCTWGSTTRGACSRSRSTLLAACRPSWRGSASLSLCARRGGDQGQLGADPAVLGTQRRRGLRRDARRQVRPPLVLSGSDCGGLDCSPCSVVTEGGTRPSRLRRVTHDLLHTSCSGSRRSAVSRYRRRRCGPCSTKSSVATAPTRASLLSTRQLVCF